MIADTVRVARPRGFCIRRLHGQYFWALLFAFCDDPHLRLKSDSHVETKEIYYLVPLVLLHDELLARRVAVA